MKKEYVLYLEQIPAYYEDKAAALKNPEFTFHTFNSFDEAMLSLYTRHGQEFKLSTAISAGRDYCIRKASVYEMPGENTLVHLMPYGEMMQPGIRTTKHDKIRSYGLQGDFSHASKELQAILHDRLDKNDSGLLPIVHYNAKSGILSELEPQMRKRAGSFHKTLLQKNNAFDYITQEFRTNDAGHFPPGFNISTQTRYHQFSEALRQLIGEHFTDSGSLVKVPPGTDEQFCCISNPLTERPLVVLTNPSFHINTKEVQAGIYLRFVDSDFRSIAWKQCPELALLSNKAEEYVTLARTASGKYWDNQAVKGVMDFMRSSEAIRKSIIPAQRKILPTSSKVSKRKK